MAEASNRTRTEEAQSKPEKCALQLKSQVGSDGFYLVPRSSQIKYLFKRHCQEKKLKYSTFTFFHNGVRINVAKTVAELGLVGGDVLDLVEEPERTRTQEAQSDHESDHVVYLHLKNQDFHDGFYRFSRDKPIKNLFKKYSEDCGSEFSTLRFIRNGGEVIKATKTPIELGLEDGDVIDVMENEDGEVFN